MSTEPREAIHVSAPAPEVPRPKCRRCEDWTTVVVMNVIFPCPVCRPAEHAAWVASCGRTDPQ
jgi:hypothetical protein